MEIFHANIGKLAKRNHSFRKVVSTADNAQLLVMSLEQGQDIGEQVHFSDQLLMVVKGDGEVVIEGMSSDMCPGDLVHVPGGTRHNICAAKDSNLKLVMVYSPPLYLHNTEHLTKADAMIEAAEDAAAAMVPSAV